MDEILTHHKGAPTTQWTNEQNTITWKTFISHCLQSHIAWATHDLATMYKTASENCFKIAEKSYNIIFKWSETLL